MANNISPLQVLFNKGNLPGITQADVVNQAHPGYFEPIGERNIGQENLAAMGITPEMEQLLFDIASGSGAPMAMGTVAKGGNSLLMSLLRKLRGGKKLTASEKKLVPQAFDLEVDRIDNAITLEQAKKAGTLGPEMTLDEFMKKLK